MSSVDNHRILALEDNMEALYDVELETGQYVTYVKGDFYQDNVIDKLLAPGDYFADLRRNIDSVVFSEDRDELNKVLQRKNIIRELDENERFEFYYRVVVAEEPIWFKIRIVYKDFDRKNVLIGVFDARSEFETNQIQEALEKVKEANHRTELLHEMIHSGWWSFDVSEDDEVTAARFSDDIHVLIDGYVPETPMGWATVLHPDDTKRASAQFMAAICDHSCNTPYDTTYRMIDRNGKVLWFHTAGRVIRHEDGTGEFFGMHVDITEQIAEKERQQKQLEEALKQAEAASSAKSSFLFNMSHDIRTPMNAITGFTAMAKKSVDDKRMVLDYLNKIDVSSQQLLMLINQVLEMARIESGKVDFVSNPVNIKERFDTMVTVLSEQAEVRGLELHYSLDGVKHVNVFADDARMSQVTLNIVGNAMKYTPEGGKVDFILREIPCNKKGWATFVFTVADTGIGMSEEYLKTLYEPFSREKNTTVSHIQGTGLGLSIVKSLVDLAGGKIEVHSEPGKGTRFDVTMDFQINDSPDAPVEPDKMPGADNFRGRHALLVEDNELNREIAKFLLEEKGVVVDEVEDGDVAVDRIKSLVAKGDFGHYDIILMDIQMPRLNGYEATSQIREIFDHIGFHIPIIALSANAFEEDRRKSREAGMDDHIAKPIEVDKLWPTLAKYL